MIKNNWIFFLCTTLSVMAAQIVCAAQSDPKKNLAASGPTSTSPATAPERAKANGVQFEPRNLRYRIEAGDSFEVSFDLSPEFNQTATVQPDGFVTLHGVGDIEVQGQTVPELTQTVRTAYGRILNDPIISIVLKDFQKPYFIADGQVGHPGKYDLRGDTTLTEAIAIAGGFTENSKHSHVQLYRRAKDGWAFAEIINVKKMESDGKLNEDPFLRPGDMLFVPKNRFSKIRPFIPNTGVNAAGKTF
jgi:polysaccharide export outer membrane protein